MYNQICTIKWVIQKGKTGATYNRTIFQNADGFKENLDKCLGEQEVEYIVDKEKWRLVHAKLTLQWTCCAEQPQLYCLHNEYETNSPKIINFSKLQCPLNQVRAPRPMVTPHFVPIILLTSKVQCMYTRLDLETLSFCSLQNEQESQTETSPIHVTGDTA